MALRSTADRGRLEKLRRSLEEWLAKHRAAIASAPRDRLRYAWSAVANDCAQLAGVLRGLDAPLEEIRAMLRESAQAHLEVVKARGAMYDPVAASPNDGYSTGSSRFTFLAICRALIVGDVDLSRALATYLWDPPNARYVGQKSLFGSEQAQGVAYALRDFLLGDRVAAQTHLDTLQRVTEDVVGELLLVQGLARPEPTRVLKGLDLALAWHAKDATTPANAGYSPYFLCVPALGLAALAVREGVVEAGSLPRDDPYFPRELAIDSNA